MQVSTIRPGLLVSLKTSIHGNVRYDHKTLEREHIVDGGAQRAVWETERVISDPAEHEAAVVARGKARALIIGKCSNSAFGLLCPEDKAAELDEKIAEARAVAEEFNQQAKLSRIAVYVIMGRIAPDDVEAVRAIKSEIRDLLSTMEQGVKNLEPKQIRDAANKAKAVSKMLPEEAQGRIGEAIEAARIAARKIKKAGEQAAVEVNNIAIRNITDARTAFLDLDNGQDVVAPEAEGRAVDFEPSPAPLSFVEASARAIELQE